MKIVQCKSCHGRKTRDQGKNIRKINATKTGDCNEPEYLMCSVQRGHSSPLFVAVLYRSPHVGLYANGFDEHLRSYGEELSHKIIMCDSNGDLIEPKADARARLNFIDEHSLKVVKHGATHHTRTTTTTSDTHKDLILIESYDRLLNFNKFPSLYENPDII